MFYYPSREEMSQHEARDFCRSLGTDWDLPDCQNHTEYLIQYMKQLRVNSIWTSLARVKYGEWLWVNNYVCKYEISAIQLKPL